MADHPEVLPVRRRRSPVDPVAGTWAVVGCGGRGRVALAALRAHGVPALGYDAGSPPADHPPPEVRWEHRVIDVAEIDDVDQLAVTSEDAVSGEINTDYVAGVVVAVTRDPGWPFVDDELMNVQGGVALLARGVFTPRHPGLVAFPPTDDHERPLVAEVVARYAAALWQWPRLALTFHRGACEPFLTGHPAVRTPAADELRADLDELAALRQAGLDR